MFDLLPTSMNPGSFMQQHHRTAEQVCRAVLDMRNSESLASGHFDFNLWDLAKMAQDE